MSTNEIEQLFKRYPNVDIILVGIIDQKGGKRPWVWNETYGWNHFFKEAIFLREGLEWDLYTPTEFYSIMGYLNPKILIYNKSLVKVFDPSVERYHTGPKERKMREDDREIIKKMVKIITPHILKSYIYRKIIIIGDYAGQCKYIADAIENKGWNVVRIATDLFVPYLLTDFYLLDNMLEQKKDEYRTSFKLYRMNKIINQHNPDHILVVENDLSLDFSGVFNKPIHYYALRAYCPRLPHNCKIDGFFHSYLGAVQQYKHSHRYRMSQVKFSELISYAWSPEQFPMSIDWDNRDIFFGFMGSYGSNPDIHDVESQDYTTVHLRDLRNKVIPHAKKFCNLQIEKKGSEVNYTKFMHRVKLALNVGAEFGWTTQRQYHAMGLGCVLIQNHYDGLNALGFKDRVNCIIYKNKLELEDIILWCMNNPKKLLEIRKEGMRLARENTYNQRAEKIMESILRNE